MHSTTKQTIKDSLWLIWPLILNMGWIGFFIIGARAKKKSWTVFGVLYLLVWIADLAAIVIASGDGVLFDVGMWVLLFQWVPQLIHLCLCWRTYMACVRGSSSEDGAQMPDAAFAGDRQTAYAVPAVNNPYAGETWQPKPAMQDDRKTDAPAYAATYAAGSAWAERPMESDRWTEQSAPAPETDLPDVWGTLTGLVGAVLGAMLGIVLWVLIGKLGYISALAGLAMSILAIKGYQVFGGKLSVVSLVVIMAIVLGMVYVAQLISYSLELYEAWKPELDWTFFDAYKLLPEVLREYPEVRSSFWMDLVVGMALTILGSIGAFKNALKGT